IDPTESSIPAVMITSPSPMLKMPNAPICRARFCRLIASRKFGLRIETMMQRTISSMKMPSSFFMGLSCGTSCQTHDRFFTKLWLIENSCQSSFVHDGDSITDASHLFHFAPDKEN